MEGSSSDTHSSHNDSTDLNLIMTEDKEVAQHSMVEDEESAKNSVDDHNLVPKVGMMFHSHEQAYDFYNRYARRVGFSIRKGHTKRFKNGLIRKRVLCCSREGFRNTRPKRTPKKVRPMTRTGCEARIQFIVQNGMFVVTKFVEEHNHSLANESEAHFLRSQRNILPQQAGFMDIMHAGGCVPTQAFTILSADHGGSPHLNVTETDCKNYHEKIPREIYKDGGAQVALNYFRYMQRENPTFSYAIQVDQNNQVCNLFWADANSKIDYGFFGDVVCFDTTFRTDKYGLPCVPIVGVNHHGMPVLFGCALLVDESTESFVWVFESFLNAMSRRCPKTILTDQAQAIANAVEQVMPNTHHRLCLWHIFQNAAKHLSHVYASNRQFKKDFQNCIYDAETEDGFQSDWDCMLEKYGLSNNEWLRGLYELRQKWVPVYGREHFCAGMTTVQTSESVNSFVKGYINNTLSINDFITQYEKAVLNWREKEHQENFYSRQTEPILTSPLPFEKQAAQVYTKNVFKTFQNRLRNFSCYLDQIEDERDAIYIHKVEMVVEVFHDKDRHVSFNSNENTVECSCKSFEFTGILCVHALRVLLSRRIFEVPQQYILKRWTKEAKAGLVINDNGITIQADFHKSSSLRYSDLAHRALAIAVKGAADEGSSLVVKRHINACLEELDAYQRKAMLEVTKAEGIGCRPQEITEEESELHHIDDHLTLPDPLTKKKKR